MKRPQHRTLLACVALVSFSLLLWAAWQVVHKPYYGAIWSLRTGTVEFVDRNGPVANLLYPGDRILTIDQVPVIETRRLPVKQASETLQLMVERANTTFSLLIRLIEPPPGVLIRDLLPLLIALAFWVLGVAVLVAAPGGLRIWLAFLFAQAMSATLAAGAVSGFGPLWTASLFGLLLWWVGPLALLFHLYFPARTRGKIVRRARIGLISVAAIGSLPDLLIDPVVLRSQFPALSTLRYLWVATCLLGVVYVLVRAYRSTRSPAIRQRAGFVTVGGSLAFLPFLTLSLLPEVLLGRPLLQYELMFLFLLLLPLSYGYAIFRYGLLPVNRYISRGATTLFLITLLGGACLLLYALLLYLLPATIWHRSLAVSTIALCTGMLVVPVYRRMEIAINRLLYGGWYDYRSAVRQVSRTLEQHADADIAQTLCHSVQAAMQLQAAYLLLADGNGILRTVSVAGDDHGKHDIGRLGLAQDSVLATYFHDQPYMIDGAALRARLKHVDLAAAEQRLLTQAQSRLWIPLVRAQHLIGLLILAPKRGSDEFSHTDYDLLEVIARHASIALQNAQLVADLQQRTATVERLHGQLVHAREAERTRVAHELHDEVIQALVGLNYSLAQMWAELGMEDNARAAALQANISRIIRNVRRLCADLRPPTLDTLGLVGAVRDRVRLVQQNVSFGIQLVVEGDEERPLPDAVALCLFRVLQEALHNVEKHAAATHVTVHLSLQPHSACLTMTDDGCGFEMPSHLNQFLDQHHFGLVGVRERLELVNGTFDIRSHVGQGTYLRVCVPLTQSKTAIDGGERHHATAATTAG